MVYRIGAYNGGGGGEAHRDFKAIVAGVGFQAFAQVSGFLVCKCTGCLSCAKPGWVRGADVVGVLSSDLADEPVWSAAGAFCLLPICPAPLPPRPH